MAFKCSVWTCTLRALWPQQSKSAFSLFVLVTIWPNVSLLLNVLRVPEIGSVFLDKPWRGFVSYKGRYFLSWFVLIVSFFFDMNCIWLHACLALKKKEKEKSQINHVLKRITCCTFDIIFIYLKIIWPGVRLETSTSRFQECPGRRVGTR